MAKYPEREGCWLLEGKGEGKERGWMTRRRIPPRKRQPRFPDAGLLVYPLAGYTVCWY
jgi:hypothetical protein